ncbi:hypothetical protein ACRRVB_04210 [Candidatus Cardinium hertigii]|uniref:hypothetical protein n=1 Tax=Candidatus Cardinium hertigii TaxID=247481 RepID=UPI003D7E13F0
MLNCIQNYQKHDFLKYLCTNQSKTPDYINSYTEKSKKILNDQLTSIINNIIVYTNEEKVYFSALEIALNNRCPSAVSLLIEKCPTQLDLNKFLIRNDNKFLNILYKTIDNINQDIKEINVDKDNNILFDWRILYILISSEKIDPSILQPETYNNILDLFIHNNDINGAYYLIKHVISTNHSLAHKLLEDISYTLRRKYNLDQSSASREIPKNLIRFLELVKEFLPDNECTNSCFAKRKDDKPPTTCKYKKCYILNFLERLKELKCG